MIVCAERHKGTTGLIRPKEAEMVHHLNVEQSNKGNSGDL